MRGTHRLVIIASVCLFYLARSCTAQLPPTSCIEPYAFPVPIWFGENGTGPACSKGFYCPFIVENDNTTWPSVCPPTINCTVTRLSAKLCEAQGLYEPIVCPAGYYCSDFRTKKICPEGHFCPLGTVEPYVCESVSECPEGSSQRRYWGALIIIACVDVTLGAVLFAYLFTRQRKAQAHSKRFKLIEPSAGGDHGHTESLETVVQMKPAVAVLVDGFARSRGNSPALDIFFEDLRLVLPKKNKTLLAGVTGSMKAGNMTAIMGPSGAGKTTFISTLMGKVNTSWSKSGTLSINGVETTCSAIKSSIGYVPQEDIMHRELTVWQNICYSADTRLPPSWTREERYAYCESILEVLNLQSVKYQRIGNEEKRGISGGQRKRVNIAIELAAAPLILFLDEPTTGLDASAALEVCEILNKIVKLTNINVAVVIHQPRIEIWNSLDNLLILAPGGRTVYLGPQKYVQDYFSTHLGLQFQTFENPADTLMDAISLNGSSYADKWKEDGSTILSQMVNKKVPPPVPPRQNKRFSKTVEVFDVYAMNNNGYNYQFEERKDTQEMHVNIETHIGDYSNFSLRAIEKRSGASWIRQLLLSHVRSVKQQAVNYQSLLIEMALSTLAGILIGMSNTDSYKGVLKGNYVLISPTPEEFVIPLKGLFINLAIGLAASAAGVRTFGDERVIYFRETASGHSPSAYYLGVSLSVLYRIFIMALHFTVLFYVVGMPMASLGHIYAICFGVYFAVYGLSAIISMIFKREDAPLTAVIATLVAAIMSGFINVFPLGLKAISYAFWSGEAFYSGEVKPFGNIYDLSVAKDVWDYDLERFDGDIVAVVFYGVAYRMIAYVLMILLNRDKQK